MNNTNLNDKNKSIVKGYKVFHKDFTCHGGFQYEVGKTYTMDGVPICCKKGFHFCLKLANCFNHYNFDPENKVAEVEAFGDVVYHKDGMKACTNGIRIVRELTWQEALDIVNTGKNCTGFKNSGDYNNGDRNSGNENNGDWNSGNKNSGFHNSGNCNRGNYNSGNENNGDNNSGNLNSGDRNSGDRNSGHRNSGHENSGNKNSGNNNTGYFNTGNRNTGDWNSGNRNAGDQNSGNYNTGDYNYGNCNTGDYNTGNCNTGDYNTGNRNSGDCNIGDYNAGNWNIGDYNTSDCNMGCFNTTGPKNPKIRMFNKRSKMTLNDWRTCEARSLISRIPKNVVKWISLDDMTEQEKQEHPEYRTTGGYLKVLDESEVATLWWSSLPEEDKNVIKALPNFDFDIFCQCVGIKTI